MKNFFQWEYNYGSFLQKDQKCLPNTDHTTVNPYQHIIEDPFNPKYSRLVLHQKEERMILCDDEDRFFNGHDNDAEDLDFLQDDDLIQSKPQSPLIFNQGDLNSSVKLETVVTEHKLGIVTVQEQTQTIKEGQILVQKSPYYKLSRRWKQKLNNVLEQKKIHQFSAKHNRNMAKFFVRLFSKYLKVCPQKQEFSVQIQQKLNEIMQKNSVSLDDLQSLFGCETSGPSRQFLSKVLRTRLKQQVIKSQDVQNKAAYLLCSKVYALRCRSRHLIGRLQSR